MKMQCWGCGTEKDTSAFEAYPYPEEERLTDEPIPPLFVIDCQPQEKEDGHDYRVVVVCHECFHKLDVDMWIGSRCWRKLNPKIVFEKLPLYDSVNGRGEPEDYSHIEVSE
jgi:hypothetical protein